MYIMNLKPSERNQESCVSSIHFTPQCQSVNAVVLPKIITITPATPVWRKRFRSHPPTPPANLTSAHWQEWKTLSS